MSTAVLGCMGHARWFVCMRQHVFGVVRCTLLGTRVFACMAHARAPGADGCGVPVRLLAWRMRVGMVLIGAPSCVPVSLRAWRMHLCGLSLIVYAFDSLGFTGL